MILSTLMAQANSFPAILAEAAVPGGLLGNPMVFIVLVTLVVAFVRNLTKAGQRFTLVIKHWYAAETVDSKNYFVNITGRREGIISWLLAMMGVDPVASIRLNAERIEFDVVSLASSRKTVIPLSKVSSVEYGFYRPWVRAIFVFLATSLLVQFAIFLIFRLNSGSTHAGPGSASILLSILLGAVVGYIFFILNRQLMVGFIEDGGVASGIRFKRSVIENKEINEDQAGYICQLMLALIEKKTEPSAKQ